MSLDLNVAGTAIPTDITALKDFKNDLHLAFSLESKLIPLLDTALGGVPASAATSTVTYDSPAACWNPGGGPVQFGLQAGVTGALSVVSGGTLLSYADGLDSPEAVPVTVAASIAYLSLTLKFTISANVSGSYSGGLYGVKAALSTDDCYAITFSKGFAPSTPVRTAIQQVFESFVLPLHPLTLAQLSDDTYLLHEFDGNLHLSFGAYAGLDKILYAGQSSADVLHSFGSPLATLSVQAQPEIKLGAKLDFSFQYATRFEALLSKTGGTARLHLFRSSNATSTATLTAGLTFDANTTASITHHLDSIQNSAANAAGGTGTLAGSAIGQVIGAASGEVDKYVAEVNDKLAGWLNRANGLQANLQVDIETTRGRTILAGYDFDLAAGDALTQAWDAAIKGDFIAALQTGAVTLDVGSGLEHCYQRRTSFKCNFFNLWSLSSWSQFSSNVSLLYAGNNVFHLVAKVGRSTETDAVGAMRSMNFYFSANANIASNGNVSDVDLVLNVDLASKGDAGATSRIAMLVSAAGGPAADGIVQSLRTFATKSKAGTVLLSIVISKAGYGRINCDDYADGKPATSSTLHDQGNWDAFVKAANELQGWPLPNVVSGDGLVYVQSFQGWLALNHTMNDMVNRLHTAYNMGVWPPSFPGLDDGIQRLVVYSLTAGQIFMNFCADLKALALETGQSTASPSWESLIKEVTGAIKNDTETDFARVAALALIRLCSAGPVAVQGPTGSAIPTDRFAVSITL